MRRGEKNFFPITFLGRGEQGGKHSSLLSKEGVAA
jgi:hypothetical protein